ncbi:MAG: alcohol dehydrogenase catalytic domain-containing protein [Deltaproteobacteria bacterium]|nr:alcohol dehydrogenase catalytic domain-containing protein [Deltaproteobacteria bacterium]
MKALQFFVSIPRFVALKALGAVKKRLYYDSPFAAIKLVDVPEPRLPFPDWVKIRTFLCGFCGSDLNLIFLRDSPTSTPFTSFPCTLGHELCGEIIEVGREVKGLNIGDIVTIAPHLGCATRGINPECRSCSMGRPGNCENFAKGNFSPGMFTGICHDIGGGFAPYLVAHKTQVFKLPEGVSYESGAMIEPLAVALQAVLDNRPDKDDRVLVIGGGVIGSLIVQSIRALDIDCDITVVEPSRFHAEFALKKGADNLITDRDIFTHTQRITGAEIYQPMMGKEILMGGFEKVFDTVGNSETLNNSMRIMSTGGGLSVVGIGSDVKIDLTPLWLKLQTIVFAYGYNSINGKKMHTFEIAMDLVKKGKIRLDDMVTHRFPLERYKEMIELNMNKGENRAIKTVISFV